MSKIGDLTVGISVKRCEECEYKNRDIRDNLLVTAGVRAADMDHDCENDYRDRSAERYIKSVGFESIEKLSEFGDYRTYLTYDTRTNVEYIVTFGNGSNGFCPYYDKDGNVVIYGGK